MAFLQKMMFQLHLYIQRKLAKLNLKYVETSQSKVSYSEGGQGPTLLLLHGFGADKDTWADLARHLVKQYRVIAIDIPDFGESYAPNDSVTMLAQAKRIEQLLYDIRVDSYGLIGSSYGGYLSALLAHRNPERVTELTLISPLGVEGTDYNELCQKVLNGEKLMLLPANIEEFKALLSNCFKGFHLFHHSH